MLEVQNINAINKGILLATCDVHIIPWKLTLHDIKIFEKGANRWIGMPAKEFTNDLGEKKYTDLITFDNDGIKNRFRNQIMGAIDKYLAFYPDMKPDNVINEDEDMPF
jgi:DNA-binding cell septation regulator SpoVG